MSETPVVDPSDTSSSPNIDPIGEEVRLGRNSVLQRPSQELIDYLQSQDPRVRYFAAEVPAAKEPEDSDDSSVRWDSPSDAGPDFFSLIGRKVGQRILDDFGGEDVMVRSTIASTIEPFEWWHGDTPAERQVRTVNDILASGSDTGKDETRVGHIEEGELNEQTMEWLDNRITSLHLEHSLGGMEDDEVRQAFPVIIVYHKSAFENGQAGHGWNNLTGPADQRIAAIYLTDKVYSSR